MKKLICLGALCLITVSISFSQAINKLEENSYVTKGKVVLYQGESISFRNLNVKDSILTFSGTGGTSYSKNLSEVYKVTKRGTWAAYGAAMGALTGLSASLSTEADVVSGELPNAEGRGQIYLIATAGCAALGGVVGLLFKKEKTLFLNLAPVAYSFPLIPATSGKHYPMLTLKFNF